MREEEMDGGVHQKVVEMSQLPSTAAVAGHYGNVRYLAQQLLGVGGEMLGTRCFGATTVVYIGHFLVKCA